MAESQGRLSASLRNCQTASQTPAPLYGPTSSASGRWLPHALAALDVTPPCPFPAPRSGSGFSLRPYCVFPDNE